MIHPNAQAHISHAQRNYRLYEQLRGAGEFLDWAVTGLFYAASHLVDAHATQAREPRFRDHMDRRDYVSVALRPVERQYRRLESGTRSARYQMWLPANADLENALRDFNRVAGHLRSQEIAW